ncbi:MAG: hypothetical protein ACK40C_06195 [Novosphingobium meiothermophilum]
MAPRRSKAKGDERVDSAAPTPAGGEAASKDGAAPEAAKATLAGLVAADLVLRLGTSLLKRSVNQRLGSAKPLTKGTSGALKGRGIVHTLVGKALVGVATRSVPGAIVVGGGLLAKTLYDRRRKKQKLHLPGAGSDTGQTG